MMGRIGRTGLDRAEMGKSKTEEIEKNELQGEKKSRNKDGRGGKKAVVSFNSLLIINKNLNGSICNVKSEKKVPHK